MDNDNRQVTFISYRQTISRMIQYLRMLKRRHINRQHPPFTLSIMRDWNSRENREVVYLLAEFGVAIRNARSYVVSDEMERILGRTVILASPTDVVNNGIHREIRYRSTSWCTEISQEEADRIRLLL